MTYVCTICKRHGFDASSSATLSKDEIAATIGTNFARFKTFTEYAWHMANIHTVNLRKTQAGRSGKSVTALAGCDCFAGSWG
jgi:hypothetical protein